MNLISYVTIKDTFPCEELSPIMIKRFVSTLGRAKGRISTKNLINLLTTQTKKQFLVNIAPMFKNEDRFLENNHPLNNDIDINNCEELTRYFDSVLRDERFMQSQTLDLNTTTTDFFETIYRLLDKSKTITIVDHMLLGHDKNLRNRSVKVIKKIKDFFPNSVINVLTRINNNSFGQKDRCNNIKSTQSDIQGLSKVANVNIYVPGTELHSRLICGNFGSIVFDNSIYFDVKKIQVWSLLSKVDSHKVIYDIEKRKIKRYPFGNVCFYSTLFPNRNSWLNIPNNCDDVEKTLNFIAGINAPKPIQPPTC